MDETKQKKYLETIANYTLMDDEFFRACMRDNPEAIQLILRIVLNDDKLIVKSMKTQEDMKNLFGKSSWFDVHAIDKDGRHLDIEIQKASQGADKKRARYYNSLLDANISDPGKKYDDLPDNFMIMIAEQDVLEGKFPLYHIHRYVEETGQKFEDGSHIIYVNGQYVGDDPLGLLIRDFHQRKSKNIHYPELKERFSFFKDTQGGTRQMSDALEALLAEEKIEGKIETLINLIKAKIITPEELIASGQATPSEIEQIEAALKQN